MLMIQTVLVAFFLGVTSSHGTPIVTFVNELPSVGATCNLNGPLAVNIQIGETVIELILTRTKGVGENTNVYTMVTGTNGEVNIRKEPTRARRNVFMYQSVEHDGEFEVTCRFGYRTPLVMEGSFELPDGRAFSLTRSKDTYVLQEETSDIHGGSTQFQDEEHEVAERLSKRASTDPIIHEPIYIDTLALIHSSVYQLFYDKATGTGDAKRTDAIDSINNHFAHIFNGIDVRFKTASENINIVLIGIIIEETSQQWYEDVKDTQSLDQTQIEAGALLDSMFELRKSNTLPPHDHLISFTSEDMFWESTDGVTDVAGLASVGQICSAYDKSVSTCEYQDRIFSEIRIAAHEMGHCLSARHDGFTGNSCDPADHFIMSSSPSSTSTNQFYFSNCSAVYFGTHVNTMLEDRPDEASTCFYQTLQVTGIPDVSDEVLGQFKDVDQQCQDQYDEPSYHCKRTDTSPVCLRNLWCTVPGSPGSCRTSALTLPGTTCGDRQWCENGECVFNANAPRADPNCIHGDQKGPIGSTGMNCSELITSVSYCESDYYKVRCCETCKQYDPPCTTTCTAPQYLDTFSCTCVECDLPCEAPRYLLNTEGCFCYENPICVQLRSSGICPYTYYASICGC